MMASMMKDKYDLVRYNRVFIITSINDHTIRFVVKVLSKKLLRKMRPNQCTAGAVALAELYVEGF